jgi:hypothetical protein
MDSTFTQTLDHLQRDGLKTECDNAVEQAIQAVLASGGKAKIKLEIEISRRGQSQVIISGNVAKTLPKAKPMPVTLFANMSGQLFITDPDQKEFDEVVKIADHQKVVKVG